MLKSRDVLFNQIYFIFLSITISQSFRVTSEMANNKHIKGNQVKKLLPVLSRFSWERRKNDPESLLSVFSGA